MTRPLVANQPHGGLFGLGLTALGGVAIVTALVTATPAPPMWVTVVAITSVLAWVARALVLSVLRQGRSASRPRPGAVVVALHVVAIVAGCIAAPQTNGLTIVPAGVSLLVLIGTASIQLVGGLALGAASIGVLAVSCFAADTPVPVTLGMIGGMILAVFAGLNRRQLRLAELTASELRERDLAVRQEQAQNALLTDRQQLAREIHDVLAHSLGGLVIQLDAVDALLEAGDAPAARDRAADARVLATEGLAEARRAVAALRAPDARGDDDRPAPTVDSVARGLRDLVTTHRSLGGIIDVTERGVPFALDGPQASALLRSTQESLSNARRYAPGQPVRLDLEWQTPSDPQAEADDHTARVRLVVSNPVSDDAPVTVSTSGHHGLLGMRERVDALRHGGRIDARVQGDRFELVVEIAA